MEFTSVEKWSLSCTKVFLVRECGKLWSEQTQKGNFVHKVANGIHFFRCKIRVSLLGLLLL